MRVSRTINHRAQYTALVDILFATIGVFVIVFALQDIEAPTDLQPAPYDHLILCEEGSSPAYLGRASEDELALQSADLRSDRVRDLLADGGRVLVALSASCLSEDGADAPAVVLHALEDELSERSAKGDSPLILFEYAPLGQGEHDAETLRERFLSELSR